MYGPVRLFQCCQIKMSDKQKNGRDEGFLTIISHLYIVVGQYSAKL